MQEILAEAKSIRDLLSGKKYAIDYYQREYNWQTKQVRELLEDVTERFIEDHSAGDDRGAVVGYGHYFLGSIIISKRNNQAFIVDGQQRMTTLTLLLIYIYNRHPDPEDRSILQDLIFSRDLGRRSFNIEVDERAECMEALYAGEPFDPAERSDSVKNLVARFGDIEDLFPEEIDDEAIPYFADWLIRNVHLVEIKAYSDEDAYTIFETMNDRGLPLSPLDMLKGFLLANVADERQRTECSKLWKRQVYDLAEIGKDEPADAVKAWLRSQHATTIRERRRGAAPGDWDRIGTEFHRWVREQQPLLGLSGTASFASFLQRDFAFFARQYRRLREASASPTPGLETVFHNARVEFTLQYPVLLAPLRATDDEVTIDRKLRATAAFVDILIARRAVNYLSLTYSQMAYSLFQVISRIRGLPVDDLIPALHRELDELGCDFSGTTDGRRRGMSAFSLNQWSKRYIRYILARITDFIEQQSGMTSRLSEYLTTSGRNRYEIEHIWANHADRHEDEFPDGQGFADYRNRIGGLLLLPKSFNASYGDMTYEEKSQYYVRENLLAASLTTLCYERNPGFRGLIDRSELPFRPHAEFKRTDLDERQSLYQSIAEQVWSPDRLDGVVTR